MHYTDWYRISREQIRDFGGVFEISVFLLDSYLGLNLYSKFGSLCNALQYAYPDIEWEPEKFSSRGKKSEQRWLKTVIEELLPGTEIVENYQHPELKLGMLTTKYHFSR
jgi:hypothetical protein